MKGPNPIDKQDLRYDHIIGTGGIGSGIFFSFPDAHTLGRNESRLARLEPFKDYCKQHIILHYITILMGSGKASFKTHPIGSVGNDKIGGELLDNMASAGMDISAIHRSDLNSTMYSICFQYPDFSGGNITTNNSACNEVSPKHISDFYSNYDKDGKKAIVLAAPEVPLAARIALLKYGSRVKSLNVVSILSSEVASFQEMNGFELTDIISINRDEACQIAGKGDNANFLEIITECIAVLTAQNNSMTILITNGADGSYCYHNGNLEFTPSINTKVVSTAGAGDAFLSGVLTGMCRNLPLFRGFDVESLSEQPLTTALELGTLLASMTVSSADTIHFGVNLQTLQAHATQHELTLGNTFAQLFSETLPKAK